MKGLYSLLFMLFVICFPSLEQHKLYYFTTADSSLIGIKDELGRVIIAAEFPNYGTIDFFAPLNTPTIEFYAGKESTNLSHDPLSPAIPMGEVYNREGKFLYYPQFYDNGPDYWKEGIRRYVENGKIGYVDIWGNKITEAIFGFGSPFNYGYADAYTGKMKRSYFAGDEHWKAVPDDDLGEYVLLNSKGQQVAPLAHSSNPKDYFYEGKYYPYPFEYSSEEKQILTDLMVDITGISILYKANYSPFVYTQLQLEITERPHAFSPYYTVKIYDDQQETGILGDAVYVDAKTKKAFIRNYEEEDIPLKKAIVDALTSFLIDRDADITSQTKVMVSKELKRLESHP